MPPIIRQLVFFALLCASGFAGAQVQPTLPIFGKPPSTWPVPEDDPEFVPPDQIGIPLTCADADAAIRQWNSGNAPGLNASDGWMEGNPPRSGDPFVALLFRSSAALPVPPSDASRWAAPPAESQWVYTSGNDGVPPEYIAYPVAIYIPTAADAERMRVTMQYRTMEQLVGVYRNDIESPNTLGAPQPTDTWVPESPIGTLELNSGWRQGDNFVTFMVKGAMQPGDVEPGQEPFERMFTGFAAAFSAECFTPSVTVTKQLLPRDDPGRFTLQVNGSATETSSAIGDSGTTGAVKMEPGQTVTLAELAGNAETDLANYSSTLTCEGATLTENTGTRGSFTMPEENVACTFTNTRKTVTPPKTTEVTPVPTLGEWSLMLMGLLAAGAGARQLRRRT